MFGLDKLVKFDLRLQKQLRIGEPSKEYRAYRIGEFC